MTRAFQCSIKYYSIQFHLWITKNFHPLKYAYYCNKTHLYMREFHKSLFLLQYPFVFFQVFFQGNPVLNCTSISTLRAIILVRFSLHFSKATCDFFWYLANETLPNTLPSYRAIRASWTLVSISELSVGSFSYYEEIVVTSRTHVRTFL